MKTVPLVVRGPGPHRGPELCVINNIMLYSSARSHHARDVAPETTPRCFYYSEERFNVSFLRLALPQHKLEYFSLFNEMWPQPIATPVGCGADLAPGRSLTLNIGVDFTFTHVVPFGIFD